MPMIFALCIWSLNTVGNNGNFSYISVQRANKHIQKCSENVHKI